MPLEHVQRLFGRILKRRSDGIETVERGEQAGN
jgi:hypothetical protein